MNGPDAAVRIGNAIPLQNIPVGSTVRNIELTLRQPFAQRRWMIELDATKPAANEWTCVQIFYAADAKRTHRITVISDL